MKIITQSEYSGASHGDCMAYLYKPNFLGVKIAPEIDSKEFNLIKQMVSYITSFIINGDPNNFYPETTWEPASSSGPLQCFNITNDSAEMTALPELDRLKVWDEICEDANVPLY